MVSKAVNELQAAKKQLLAQINGLESEIRQIDNAVAALAGLSGSSEVTLVPSLPVSGKRTMSAAGRNAIAAAARARWAKFKAGQTAVATPQKKRQMSAAAKAKLSAFQKKRWAKINAAKK